MGWLPTRLGRRCLIGAAVTLVATSVVVGPGVGATGSDPIATLAGTGVAGFSGDGGQASAAQLNFPRGVAIDAAGNVYIGDRFNHRVRKISPAGVITTFAGTGVAGFSGDGGQASAAQLNHPRGIAIDAAGAVYITDTDNHRVRKVSPTGVITTFAGTGVAGFAGDGGQAAAAQLNFPRGVAVDAAGNVYIADSENLRVRKVSPTGVITTLAGTGVAGFSGDGGQATAALLEFPFSVAVDASGNVYIADSEDHRVRKVSPAGVITTLAGTGVAGFSGDGGQATAAQLRNPTGVAVDGAGNVYIADRENNRVRKVDPAGVITTLAGTGVAGFSGDGGQAATAQIDRPYGIGADATGNVYISDTENQRVRKIAAPLAPSACTITGTAGADVLNGTAGADVICGRGGNDRINGRGGDDILRGEGGNDVIDGGPGADTLLGGAGKDVLRGGAGRDTANGGPGRDTCVAETRISC